MDVPLLRDAAVAIADGVIVAAGDANQVITNHPEYAVEDLGDAVLLPGLVNAHTHLEFSLAECGAGAGASFGDWLLNIRSRTPAKLDDAAAWTAEQVRAGAEQSLRFGVTCLGDISQEVRVTRAALAGMTRKPRVVSYGEVLGLAKRRFRVDELLGYAIDDEFASSMLRIAITPHAPYTVDRPGYERCLRIAREQNLPLATHLAESDREREFLESHAGPFQELWARIGMWEEPVDTFRGSPIAFAQAIGLLDYPTLLAHVNYCDDEELAILSRGWASVVYCPRTHRYFNHPPHRWREMLAAGINVAVGTDSCASSPNLNVIDDLRILHNFAPEVLPHLLWEMATIRGARAVQMHEQVGTITSGKRADLITFDVRSLDPLGEILETSDARPGHIWIDGQQIY
ncbi:MAG: amidohydrolase family protein [Anaerolineae bacterium]|nr:amidohydrolase family protein [Phycisphaerae bacterium]